mgnify:CR=1 FL=1
MKKSNKKIKRYLEYLDEMALMVRSYWIEYKVCEGCDVVIEDSIYVCPVCKAYRFDKSKERIFQALEQLQLDVENTMFKLDTDSSLEEDVY